jgi:hypothetical protein
MSAALQVSWDERQRHPDIGWLRAWKIAALQAN